MRAVIQRVQESRVEVEGQTVSAIAHGYLVLLGVESDDSDADLDYTVEKILGLRVFSDAQGKFNLSLLEVGGAVLLVSQFTLHGDCRRGRRPSFIRAARPEHAAPLYERAAQRLRDAGVTVAMGVFGAHMEVHLVNDGPVTILIDSRKTF